MLTRDDLRSYIADPHELRRSLILPDGRRYGDAEEPWQREHVFAALDERDGDGWRYRLVYLELPRGHAKTTMAAMEALTVGLLEPDVRIVIAAADKDQAMILFDQLRGFIERSPSLRTSFKVMRDKIIVKNGTEITVLAADGDTNYGLGGLGRGFIAIVDELWAHRSPDLWHALWSATGKMRDWRVLVLSNAGFDQTSIAYTVRKMCADKVDPAFYLYSADGPVASWLTPTWIEMQRRSLPPHVFQRLIENKWVSGSGSFVTRAELDACIDPLHRPQLEGVRGVRYIVGLDLGLTHDRTARAVLHFDRDADRVVLDDLKVWQGSKGSPVNIAEIEDDLLDVDRRFHHPAIWADPWQMQSSMQRLRSALRIEPFTFTSTSVSRLSANLFTLLHNGKLLLYPDAALETELLRLEAIQTGYGWRIDHKSGGYSDRAMAIGMAALDATKPRVRFRALDGDVPANSFSVSL